MHALAGLGLSPTAPDFRGTANADIVLHKHRSDLYKPTALRPARANHSLH